MAITVKQQGSVVKGKVTTEYKDGSIVEQEEVVKEVINQGPTANVGVSIGLTKNLGNYEALKITVSLFMPCQPTAEDIEYTYTEAKGWVDDKINTINAEVDASLA